MSWRNITVDGTKYRWSPSTNGFVVRNPETNQKWVMDCLQEATPGVVARSIQVKILGKTPVSTPIPVRQEQPKESPKVVQPMKLTICAVMKTYYNDNAGFDISHIIEIYEDPKMAIEAAKKWNEKSAAAERFLETDSSKMGYMDAIELSAVIAKYTHTLVPFYPAID